MFIIFVNLLRTNGTRSSFALLPERSLSFLVQLILDEILCMVMVNWNLITNARMIKVKHVWFCCRWNKNKTASHSGQCLNIVIKLYEYYWYWYRGTWMLLGTTIKPHNQEIIANCQLIIMFFSFYLPAARNPCLVAWGNYFKIVIWNHINYISCILFYRYSINNKKRFENLRETPFQLLKQ